MRKLKTQKAFFLIGCGYAKPCDLQKLQRLYGVKRHICLSSEACSQQKYGFYGTLQEDKKTHAKQTLPQQ